MSRRAAQQHRHHGALARPDAALEVGASEAAQGGVGVAGVTEETLEAVADLRGGQR